MKELSALFLVSLALSRGRRAKEGRGKGKGRTREKALRGGPKAAGCRWSRRQVAGRMKNDEASKGETRGAKGVSP